MTLPLVNQPFMQSLDVCLCKPKLFSRGGKLCLQLCRLLPCRILAVCCKAWARRPVPSVIDQQLGDDGGGCSSHVWFGRRTDDAGGTREDEGHPRGRQSLRTVKRAKVIVCVETLKVLAVP